MDANSFWRFIRRKKHKQDNYHNIVDGTETYTMPCEQAGMWKHHFSKLLNESTEENDLYDLEWKSYIDEAVHQISLNSESGSSPDGVDMSPFTFGEITEILPSLPNGKAPGLDMLAYEHIKLGGPHIIQCITKLYNSIVRLIWVPTGFKKGLLIPLYKGGKKPRSNINSYRGITLLPVLSKLFDKCIRGRLDTKLQHIKFPPPQIHSTMEKHGKVYSAFLDIEIEEMFR